MFTKEFIEKMILSDNAWLERGVLAIFARQEESEKQRNDAEFRNRKGFSSAHASRLSKSAKWILSGRHLDPWHLEKTREYMIHYVGQLTEIANNKARAIFS